MSRWYDFKDWEQALRSFRELKGEDDRWQLVMSTASYTSGYWIEMEPDETDVTISIYATLEAVQALEIRIRNEMNRLSIDGRNPLNLGGVIR